MMHLTNGYTPTQDLFLRRLHRLLALERHTADGPAERHLIAAAIVSTIGDCRELGVGLDAHNMIGGF